METVLSQDELLLGGKYCLPCLLSNAECELLKSCSSS